MSCDDGFDKKFVITKNQYENEAFKNNPYNKAYDETLGLWDVDYEEIYVQTSYGKAHVIVSGPRNGEPLVLLHGMNASSTMWYPNMKALNKNYRTFAIDFLLEAGKSENNNDIDQWNQVVDWYQEIFQHLGLHHYSLIGASRGGWIATKLAISNPDQINSLTLLSPAQTFTYIDPSFKMLSNIFYTIFPRKSNLDGVMETMSVKTDNISPLYMKQYYLGGQKSTFDPLVIKMTPFEKQELVKLQGIPTMLLVGDKDIVNDADSIEEARKFLPNIKFAIVKNAGHFLSVDQADKVNNIILNFLGDI